MKLPGGSQAVIDERKIREYLLSRVHPIGRFKAAYFATLGYTSSNWRDFETALRVAATESDAERLESSPYGQKYRVRSIVTGLSGQSGVVVSIWMIRHGEDTPRLVTVTPE